MEGSMRKIKLQERLCIYLGSGISGSANSLRKGREAERGLEGFKKRKKAQVAVAREQVGADRRVAGSAQIGYLRNGEGGSVLEKCTDLDLILSVKNSKPVKGFMQGVA